MAAPAGGDGARAPAAAVVLAAQAVCKGGLEQEQCEDACGSAVLGGRLVVAVADGATTAIFSRLWAQVLVERYLAEPVSHLRDPWLTRARQRWRAQLPPLDGSSWSLLQKLQYGSFASLLGLQIVGWRWSAVACGDSCLFLVRQDQLARQLPLATVEGLRRDPWLVPTLPPAEADEVGRHASWSWGRLRPGDRLLLMTDALAAWFLAAVDQGQRPWAQLARPWTLAELQDFVAERRAEGAMRNDDVALVVVGVG